MSYFLSITDIYTLRKKVLSRTIQVLQFVPIGEPLSVLGRILCKEPPVYGSTKNRFIIII